MDETKESKTGSFPATVVKVLNESKVVINRGASDGIKIGQRFLIYKIDEEPIIDPDTGDKLGYLEVIRGTGKVSHVQDRLSTIESDRTEKPEKRVIKRGGFYSITFGPEEEIITPINMVIPFEEARIGDKAKPI